MRSEWLALAALTGLALCEPAIAKCGAVRPDLGADAPRPGPQRHFNAVTVPFELKGGAITFQATIAGSSCVAFLDTGAGAAQVPLDVYKRGRPTGYMLGSAFLAQGERTTVKEVRVRTIAIGAYKVADVACCPLDKYLQRLGTMIGTGEGTTNRIAWFGNSVFDGAVLTIDYDAQVLTIHDSSYDVQKLERKPGDILLRFIQADSAPGHFYGHVVIQSHLNGVPAACVLDTGTLWPGIVVDKAVVAEARVMLGKASVPATLGASSSTSPKPSLRVAGRAELVIDGAESYGFVRPVAVMGLLPPGVHGIIGYSILKYFRVTIDYTRHVILLEPYAPRSPPVPGSSHDIRIDGFTLPSVPNGSILSRDEDGSITVTPGTMGVPAQFTEAGPDGKALLMYTLAGQPGMTAAVSTPHGLVQLTVGPLQKGPVVPGPPGDPIYLRPYTMLVPRRGGPPQPYTFILPPGDIGEVDRPDGMVFTLHDLRSPPAVPATVGTQQPGAVPGGR